MSERLIVEFYWTVADKKPEATILAYFGGQEPLAAAHTLAAFLNHIQSLTEPRMNDAGLLAARFVAWQAYECRDSETPADFQHVAIIEDAKLYPYYLVAKVYANSLRPYVAFADDPFLSDDELVAAAEVLGQERAARIP